MKEVSKLFKFCRLKIDLRVIGNVIFCRLRNIWINLVKYDKFESSMLQSLL